MQIGPNHTVWILGAGFSRPLGGSLLKDLLSVASYRDLEAHYPGNEKLKSPETVTALQLYHYGRQFRDEAKVFLQQLSNRPAFLRSPGERMWEDAEEYLDKLDAAVTNRGSGGEARLNQIVSEGWPTGDPQAPTLESVRNAAQRLMALECTRFLSGTSTDSEVWRPYNRWSKKLSRSRENHTIISFNYDRVLEKLGHFKVRLPESQEADYGVRIHALKLHGSVDWMREGTEGGRRFTRVKDQGEGKAAEDFPAWCEDDRLAIAAPGPSKSDMAEQLKELWDDAAEYLRNARSIVFVGYRFPPTDALAREELLGAIRTNKPERRISKDSQDLDLHIVLGPNTGEADTIRLEALLRYTARLTFRGDADRVGHDGRPGIQNLHRYRLEASALLHGSRNGV